VLIGVALVEHVSVPVMVKPVLPSDALALPVYVGDPPYVCVPETVIVTVGLAGTACAGAVPSVVTPATSRAATARLIERERKTARHMW
jgi:hypothetical protein